MRKYLLFVFLVLLLTGCGNNKQTESDAMFYYPNSQVSFDASDGVISSEPRDCGGMTTMEILSLYLSGPLTDTCRNPFPREVCIVNCETADDSTSIIMSDQYAALTGVELSLANACLSKTAMKLTGCGSVTIHCESKLLDGKESITVTTDSILLWDKSADTDK